MLVTSMRTKFKKRCNGLADALSDTEIDEYFNRWYQGHIPAEVGGEFADVTWSLTCVSGTQTYTRPHYIQHALAKGVHILSTATGGDLGTIYWIDSETRPWVWNATDRAFPETSGIPTSCLFDNNQVSFSPIPDDDYVVVIPSVGGPSIKLGTDVGETSELEDENHVMAVITGASSELLADEGDVEGAAAEAEWHSVYVGFLRDGAFGMPQHRRPIRSYK